MTRAKQIVGDMEILDSIIEEVAVEPEKNVIIDHYDEPVDLEKLFNLTPESEDVSQVVQADIIETDFTSTTEKSKGKGKNDYQKVVRDKKPTHPDVYHIDDNFGILDLKWFVNDDKFNTTYKAIYKDTFDNHLVYFINNNFQEHKLSITQLDEIQNQLNDNGTDFNELIDFQRKTESVSLSEFLVKVSELCDENGIKTIYSDIPDLQSHIKSWASGEISTESESDDNLIKEVYGKDATGSKLLFRTLQYTFQLQDFTVNDMVHLFLEIDDVDHTVNRENEKLDDLYNIMSSAIELKGNEDKSLLDKAQFYIVNQLSTYLTIDYLKSFKNQEPPQQKALLKDLQKTYFTLKGYNKYKVD